MAFYQPQKKKEREALGFMQLGMQCKTNKQKKRRNGS